MFALISLILIAMIALAYWRTSRFAYESAPYSLIRADSNIEIRDYPRLVLAATPMNHADPNRGNSFGKLFRFITGGNCGKQQIAMTTPVLIDSGVAPSMSFVMPAALSRSDIQNPTDESVALREFRASRYAALRFTGSISKMNQDEAYARLKKHLNAMGLLEQGDPLYAYYDPPWTPPFWRRNEVLVRVAVD